MRMIQEPNKVALWNKRHFEEKKTEIMQHIQNIQHVYLLNKYLKCSVWRLALRYDIYIYMSLGFKRLIQIKEWTLSYIPQGLVDSLHQTKNINLQKIQKWNMWAENL